MNESDPRRRIRALGVLEARIRAGGQGQNRTADTAIFSRVLYQLSYLTGRFAGPSVERPGAARIFGAWCSEDATRPVADDDRP
jgi:hypothetical protein